MIGQVELRWVELVWSERMVLQYRQLHKTWNGSEEWGKWTIVPVVHENNLTPSEKDTTK